MVRLWRCRYYRCCRSDGLESSQSACLSASWLVCTAASELLSVGSHGSSSLCYALDSRSDFLIVQGVELVKVEKFWHIAIVQGHHPLCYFPFQCQSHASYLGPFRWQVLSILLHVGPGLS